MEWGGKARAFARAFCFAVREADQEARTNPVLEVPPPLFGGKILSGLELALYPPSCKLWWAAVGYGISKSVRRRNPALAGFLDYSTISV